MKPSGKYVLYVLVVLVSSILCLLWAYHLSLGAFPINTETQDPTEFCVRIGYGLCNIARGFSFFDLTLVSLPFIALVSFVGAWLGFDKKKNIVASLIASVAWVLIINIVTLNFNIPIKFIAPYSGSVYVNYSYIPFSPNMSIILEAPIYLVIFAMAHWLGYQTKKHYVDVSLAR